MPEWILASASPRRKEILSRLGMKFHIDPCHILEPSRKSKEKPSEYVVRLAGLKAGVAGKKYRSGLVIGADTIVVQNNELLGKPDDREDAKTMLKVLSGHWHEVLTGLCILDCDNGRSRADVSSSRVHFRRLTEADIAWYLGTGEYLDKAGAYAIQGYASLFIDRIEGCYFNIVGFPITLFERLCRQSGIRLQEYLNKNSRERACKKKGS
jgi:septum formation protein